MKDLLEVLRVQRHNFVNHLQVISGLLQLKKYDRALDYIRQIGEETSQASLVGRLEIPEVVGAILISELAASKRGITVDKKITTGLDKGIENSARTGELIREMMDFAINMIDAGASEKLVELRINEKNEEYIFEVIFKSTGSYPGGSLGELLSKEVAASAIDGSFSMGSSGEGIVLTLSVPPVKV